MEAFEQLVERLQKRIEYAGTLAERQEALEDLAIVAELAHRERDRVLERAAQAVLAGAGV